MSLKHVYGSSSCPKGIQIYNGEKIFYVAGINLVKCKIEKMTQEILKRDPNTQKIFGIELSQNKNYLAVAESIKSKIYVNLYDPVSLSKKHLFVFMDIPLVSIK